MAEWERGAFDQEPRKLGSASEGYRLRARADLSDELAVKMPLAVVKTLCKPSDAFAVDDPVAAIMCIARATTSERAFHSGDPGAASGRHRLQLRNPADWAAAAVEKNRVFSGLGIEAGQLGRQ
jgi:hypothetical protein